MLRKTRKSSGKTIKKKTREIILEIYGQNPLLVRSNNGVLPSRHKIQHIVQVVPNMHTPTSHGRKCAKEYTSRRNTKLSFVYYVPESCLAREWQDDNGLKTVHLCTLQQSNITKIRLGTKSEKYMRLSVPTSSFDFFLSFQTTANSAKFLFTGSQNWEGLDFKTFLGRHLLRFFFSNTASLLLLLGHPISNVQQK